MRTDILRAREWAVEEFGDIDLGHASRTARLVRIATGAAMRPAGKITEVFSTAADLEGAYRWIENPSIGLDDVVDGIGRACAARAAEHPFVFIPTDGSSLTLVDGQKLKGFGPIGPNEKGARGVKVLGAIAVSPDGVPLGVAALEWWCRSPSPKRKGTRKRSNAARPTAEKETQRWLDAVTNTTARFAAVAPQTRCWFQLDREADSWPLLHHLAATGHEFTVRSSRNRRLAGSKPGKPRLLRNKLKSAPIVAKVEVDVSAGPRRTARRAHLTVRATTLTLELRNPWTKTCRPLSVQAVWVREQRTTPRGESPLDWLLFTNHKVDNAEDALLVVQGYCQRWRIEDFHKTWKSGACNVEQSQLRAASHVMKWATVLAAVALRIERLKLMARSQADLAASVELTPHEVKALVLCKRRNKKRTEPVPENSPTIGQAVLWIAQMGGYTGKSSGGPPGAITIGRGLERLRHRAAALEDLEFSRNS